MSYDESDKTVRRGRTGEHKSDQNLQDIYNLLQEKGDNAPTFCAKNLNILPPRNTEECERVQPAAYYYTVADRSKIAYTSFKSTEGDH